MTLGEVVGLVGSSWLLLNNKLELFDPVFFPVEMQVHGFGVMLFERVIPNVFGPFVVSLDAGGGLWIAQLSQYNA
jgi:hypothetical protein